LKALRRRAGNTVSCLSVTLRRGRLVRTGGRTRPRYLGVLGPTALAALLAVAIGGCTATGAPADPATGTHDLSLAGAETAYRSYLTVSETAAAQADQIQGLSDVAYAQWAVVDGQYTALASAGTPVVRYRYGQPVFYVPALSTYPQWFMVVVPRTTDTGGRLGAAVNTIMVFERPKPSLPWTLNGSAVLDQKLPPIARDSAGYAIDVSTTDQHLLVRPDVVGPTQAAVVDEGPANPAASLVSGGPQTTGLYTAQAAYAKAEAARGLQYQWLLQGASYPQFELQTADGGALVLYGMDLNTTTEHPGLAPGPPIPVPAQFSPLLAAPTEIGYHAVYADWTFEYATVDPPLAAPHAKIEVIAVGGGPSFGHAY
jgi:hypothetical protein